MSTSGVPPSDNEESEFHLLPDEVILDDIMVSLGFSSIFSLVSMGKSNKRFANIIQDPQLWKSLILHYFPYLSNTCPDEYHSDSRMLFINEYKRYQELDRFKEMHLGIEAILAALAGLENGQVQNEGDLLELYKLSLANGKYEAWSKLTPYKRGCAFNIAAENGHIDAIKWFLTEKGADFSGAQRGIALRVASHYNRQAVVECILKLSSTPDFLEQLKSEIKFVSPETTNLILNWAHDNNHKEILDCYDTLLDLNIITNKSARKKFG